MIRAGAREGRPIMRRLFQAGMLVACVLATTMLGGSALAANGSLSVSPSTTTPGGTVHFSGSVPGCSQSGDVTLTSIDKLFPPDGFGPTTQVDANGSFAVDYTVPTSTPPGSYRVGLRCGGGNVGVSTQLRVQAAPSGGPATGAGGTAHGSSTPWIALGVACLALAGVLVALRRKLA